MHPEENRTITAREAALLQTFPSGYKFPTDIPRGSLALMIGNALPTEFCRQQAQSVQEHLDVIFTPDIDKEKRSEKMRTVKDKGTKQELQIRKLFCKIGFNRYRLSTSKLVCSPDIVLPRLKKAVFINGCFWHGHNCSRGVLPASNVDFWKEKIANNRKRDENNYQEVTCKGWTYLVIR